MHRLVMLGQLSSQGTATERRQCLGVRLHHRWANPLLRSRLAPEARLLTEPHLNKCSLILPTLPVSFMFGWAILLAW